MPLPPEVTIAPGTLIAGKYRVEGPLARGGMGELFRARHGTLDTPVALKVLGPEALAQHGGVDRFLREARAAAGLRSEFVARVTDHGTLEDGRPFLVMDLLEGEDLATAIQRRHLGVRDAVDAVVQACAGLAEAHAAGIVHRDLKPSNLFRVRRSDGSCCTKVLDFGISQVAELAVGSMLTSAHSVLGTPFYMSPEQVRGPRRVDARSDIWSLGVVLYEALTSTLPFRGETLGEIFAGILQGEPAPFDAVRRGEGIELVPPGLESIVCSCLEKRADRRPQSAAQLALMLAPFGSIESQVAAQRAQTAVVAPRAAPPSPSPSPSPAMGSMRTDRVEPPASASRAGPVRHVADASRLLLAKGFTHASVRDALGVLGRGVHVDRVYIFEDGEHPDTHERVTSQRHEWVAPGVSSQIDDPGCQSLPWSAFGAHAPTLARGSVVAILPRELEPGPLRHILITQGVLSLLLCPIVQDGKTWGFVGFDDCHTERRWLEDEVAALRSFARAMTASLRQAATRETFQRARQQLRSLL